MVGFSYHEFGLLLAKLRFVEIADGLNASSLEMRLAEKNYFLYKDIAALEGIKTQIKEAIEAMFKAKVADVKTYITNGKKRAYIRFSAETPAIDIATQLGLM